MARINVITGVKKVLANMKARETQLAAGASIGLRKAGLLLQRESQKKVPVDTGNLKNSAFTRSTGVGFGTLVTVGYTASYAMFVHENVEMKLKGQPRPPPSKGKYWDPQGRGQSKFLEEPMRTHGPDFVRILKESMKII